MKTPHVIERAAERYGLALSWSSLRVLRELCRDQDGVLILQDRRKGHEQWLVELDGVEIAAVYDREAHEVITVVPWEGRSEFRLAARVRVTDHGQAVGLAALLARVEGAVHVGA